jgi:hypothetical protein
VRGCYLIWFKTIERGYCTLGGDEWCVVIDLSLNAVFKCSKTFEVIINMTVVYTSITFTVVVYVKYSQYGRSKGGA